MDPLQDLIRQKRNLQARLRLADRRKQNAKAFELGERILIVKQMIEEHREHERDQAS
jgi:hypothetical protein